MKTFEEELYEKLAYLVCDYNHGGPMPSKEALSSDINSILDAHQAEMDRVVNETIGNQRCTGECLSPYKIETRPSLQNHSYACVQVRARVKEQRARYKAIKNA